MRCRRLIASLLLCCPAVAAAQDMGRDYEERTPGSMREGLSYDPDIVYPGSGQLGFDVAAYYRSFDENDSIRVFRPVVEGWYAPSERWAVSFQVPFTITRLEVEGSTFNVDRVGNVTIGGHLSERLGATSLGAGVAIAAPTARIGERDRPGLEPFVRVAYDTSSIMGGRLRPWLWWPERLGIVVPLRASQRVAPLVAVSVDATGAAGVAAGDDTGEVVEGAGVVSPEVTLDSEHFTAGARVPLSVTSLRGYQLSAQAFVRWVLDTVYLSAALTLSLAGQADFAFSDDGVWAVHLGGGTLFGEGARAR